MNPTKNRKEVIMLRKIAFGVAIVLALNLFGFETAHAKEKLKLSFNVALGSTWDAGAQKFKSLVEERSDGRFEVEIYPNAMLANGNDRVEIEMLQAGAIDMVLKSTVWLSQLDPRFMGVALPFVFKSNAEVGNILDGKVGDELGDALKSAGITPLGWGLGGSFELCTKDRKVAKAADVSGLKIRMPGIQLFVDAYNALGAVPVTMSFAEAFTALQTGTVDADTCGISLLYSSRFYEAVKHISLSHFSYEAIGLLINSSRFNKMSEADQKMIAKAAKEAMSYQREFHIEEEERILKKLPGLGMTITTPDAGEIEIMERAVSPVIKQYREEIGPEFIELVLSEAGK
jgi:tripartite ATP-independent transporter DctP family solute receptor